MKSYFPCIFGKTMLSYVHVKTFFKLIKTQIRCTYTQDKYRCNVTALEQVEVLCSYFIPVKEILYSLSITNVMLSCLFTDIYFVNIVQFDLFMV